ncbi:hypothetical protein C8R45DRAFT_1188052 [Mycena sanguinolenta]|nr:hypothetical protein C8R45DRAFT_1188052 [Mycena sanguinolenta]
MLLILSSVYLLAGHRAVSGLPLVSRDAPISCDSNINSRSLFTILSGGLVTVFACTWVSVHPNVPPPNQSKLALFGRRLGLMLVAVVFQFVSIFIWALWWYKPLNVQQPILIAPFDECVRLAGQKQFAGDELAPMFTGIFSFDPLLSTSVPAFWSTHGIEFQFGVDGFQTVRMVQYLFIQFITGIIFGVIHCVAWDASFPSANEMLLWRSCALVVVSAPLALALAYIFLLFCAILFDEYPPKWVWSLPKWVGTALLGTATVLGAIALWTYFFARLILIPLAFTTLRSLPPNAFVDVN